MSKPSIPASQAFKIYFLILAGVLPLLSGPRARAQSLPSVAPTGCPSGKVCITTWMYQPERDGLNLKEGTLTSTSEGPPGGSNFAKKFSDTATQGIDDSIYAQPLFLPSVCAPDPANCTTGHVHNLVYVATESATVYAFDGDSQGSAVWSTPLLPTNRMNVNEFVDFGSTCANITPDQNHQHNIGVTGTPVIDLTSNQGGANITGGTLYVVDGNRLCVPTTCVNPTSVTYYQTLSALDVTTGAILAQTDISLTNPTGSGYSWDPKDANQRGALLFLNGSAYIPFASHCDQGNWAGWLASYKLQTGTPDTLPLQSTWLVTPETVSSANGGGIWGAGAGPAGDDSNNVYAVMGNGQVHHQSKTHHA